MRYLSLFSGVGGFDLALNRAGHQCIGYSEIDRWAIQTYQKNFGTEVKNYGNAREIKPEELPDFDLLCGGFPCQSFSIAGKRQGFQDTRGTLFHEICQIVAVKRPRLLLLENVKGLLSADDGRCFATIISSLDELGYNVEWEVLNSKYFGVPQNRERVFIVGHLRGTSSRQVFPLGKNGEEIINLQTLTARYNASNSNGNYVCYPKEQREMPKIISHSPRSGDPKKGGTGQLSSEEHSFTLDSTPHMVELTIKQPKENGEEMFTLNTQDKHGVFDGRRIRKLTPTECSRLQSFPDDWCVGSDSQKYKQLGNAVTVNVISAIVEKMKEQ